MSSSVLPRAAAAAEVVWALDFVVVVLRSVGRVHETGDCRSAGGLGNAGENGGSRGGLDDW
jgi:hypothetical protein